MDLSDVRLPKSNSSTASGLRSGTYATISAFIVFGTGLLTVLKGVPGCSEAVISFIQSNALQLSLLIGVPAGVFSFVVGLFTPSKKNY